MVATLPERGIFMNTNHQYNKLSTPSNEEKKIWSILETITDPEVPDLSILDLGIVRNIKLSQNSLLTGGDLEGAGGEVSEDSLAYFRNSSNFKNLLLVEQPKGDWAQTILRQFFFSAYQYLLFEKLRESKDEQIAAIANKAFKEITYHLRWSSEWVIRLGDGTRESKGRMLKAIDNLLPYTGEFFTPADYEGEKITGFDLADLKQQWLNKTLAVLNEATLGAAVLQNENIGGVFMQTGGKQGIHTENLGFILAEMQYLQRMHPGAEW